MREQRVSVEEGQHPRSHLAVVEVVHDSTVSRYLHRPCEFIEHRLHVLSQPPRLECLIHGVLRAVGFLVGDLEVDVVAREVYKLLASDKALQCRTDTERLLPMELDFLLSVHHVRGVVVELGEVEVGHHPVGERIELLKVVRLRHLLTLHPSLCVLHRVNEHWLVVVLCFRSTVCQPVERLLSQYFLNCHRFVGVEESE